MDVEAFDVSPTLPTKPGYVSPAQPPAGPSGPVAWRTLPDGRIEVDGEGIVLPRSAAHEQRIQRVAAKWADLAREQSARTGVPASWILAIVDAESSGDPSVVSPVGAVGLMQIMPSWWRGNTAEQMKDARTNATIGTDLLADIARRPGVAWELPKAASVYNCGSDKASGEPRSRPDTRWGMCAEGWYLDDVTRANNRAVELLGQARPASSGGGLVALAALAWLVSRLWR